MEGFWNDHKVSFNWQLSRIQPGVFIQGGQKLTPFVLYDLISSNIDQFSNLFHGQNYDNICNNTVTKDPTTPQMYRYTTLWNVSVLKATTEKKTSSITNTC